MTEIVPLNPEYLDALLSGADPELRAAIEPRAYFSPGSVALCLLADGAPVFSGGILNMEWRRGEAWLLNTPFFRTHVKTCLRIMRTEIPRMARESGFRRVQATCFQSTKDSLIRHLGFDFEGNLRSFGPHGENCSVWSRIFE